ncbi:molybdopterin-dependent oxidoreductase [Herbiconiux sp. CPCC 203407]|uniref:Molybdopterin-dependent oxidoreductase n=1 Tax=Herbiconiux oxytropis TaxID=2970915 RepID=A0AA42BSZ6_9MICO|nr:molybdopterin-dependent oxidoreductase [Herbiconiux oxytropis]MCS5723141.1 molybdopterin-dependent oxidoreductase [Herbiconiux oxytropis]MCS5725302.1 molybdopterin-dependent oxidoreductase [Herbiconiux oxytropis]
MSAGRARLWAAVAGVVAAASVLGAAEIVAVFVGAEASPLFAVGSLVIDLAPPGVKDLVISLFGTADKIALLVLLGVLVLALAVAAGLLERWRRPFGAVLLVVVSAVAILAVTTRAGASGLWALPTVVGMVVGVLVLHLLVTRLRAWETDAASAAGPRSSGGVGDDLPAATTPQGALDRRRFLGAAGIAGAAAVFGGLIARSMNATANAVSAVREAVRLPAAAAPAAAAPAGAELGLDGLTPYITGNDGFYRIDTALQVPQLDSAAWRLRVTGLVEQEVEIGFDELLALPLEEHLVTLACVSNEVGGDLIGNALWLGYPIRELLARAKPLPEADMVLSVSSDGFTAGTPLEALQDDGRVALLAVGMNGEPLPVEHGFPVRMVVAGLYGYVSATKWVVELRVTRFDEAEGYWTPRGWSELGPIKTQSRIDVPAMGRSMPAGTVAVAGVAWAQHTGIEKVEVRVDDGAWQAAELAETAGVDTWVQWTLAWQATPGEHTLTVRATDRSGATQTEKRAPVVPDGASGWDKHTVTVN